MFEILSQMLSYEFIQRAMLVGVLVALCASLLGVSLVLKRYAMIGDGLSHVGFGALAIATALELPQLAVSLPIVIVTAFLLLRLNENSKIKSDSAIALISTGSLAVGAIIIAKSTGMNTDVCNYLFGSILAMTWSDVYLSVGLSITVIILFVLFYNKIFAVTFDEGFSKASGTRVGTYNMLIALLTAVTIVIGMRLMGAMLISSLIIVPALSSMRLCKSFKAVVICSAVISLIAFIIGMVLAYAQDLPPGASVVGVNVAIFIVSIVVGRVKGRVAS